MARGFVVTGSPYGQTAWAFDLGIDDAPDRAARTHAVARHVAARFPEADVVTGAGMVVVVGSIPCEQVAAAAQAVVQAAEIAPPGKLHRVAAAYDGPDLNAVAKALGTTAEAVVAMHSGRDYLVELLGFLPGFAYLGELDPRLQLPRRPSPRPSIAAGSIGIAGAFTGIYPFASPGGWNLIARALSVAPFDADRDPPMLFSPGDRVRFEPVSGPAEPERVREREREREWERERERVRAFEIVSAPACATVQDAGRAGQLGRGIPPSGPLDPAAFAAANRAVGNPAGTAAVEVPLGTLEFRALGAMGISVDGEPLRRMAAGDRCVVPSSARAVRYLAVRGGIDVPPVLGARATLLVARIGGFGGRPLRRGDILPIGDDGACGRPDATVVADPPDGAATLEIDPGPHLDRFPAGALPALLTGAFRVSRLGDRVGVRLEGGRIPRDRPDFALPVPMIRGAVQVTTDGTPIVLGPDHPTTGGYPVIAVVRTGSQADLARRRPGQEVRFQLGR
jgi:KipI family sensor histidine kinase inhibitor